MKNYLIVGGSSGIGLELVKNLAADGHRVFASYNQNPMQDYDQVTYQAYDVLNDTDKLTDLPDTLDGLVYCPGKINLKPFRKFTDTELIDDLRLQVIGAARVIRETLPKLKQSDHSSIVLFSTVAVQSGFNFHTQVSISKGAVEGLTRALAAEFAPRIRVNAIAPSLTNTPLAQKYLSTPEKMEAQAKRNPLNKVGSPEELANVASFLLSEKASWITGQIIGVDGGMSVIKG